MFGVFSDITERKRAEARRVALLELTDRFRDVEDPADLAYAAAEIMGRVLEVSRAGFGTIDPIAETITIDRDWNAPGIKSLAGVLHFREYGSYIEDLKRGDTVVMVDADQGPAHGRNGRCPEGDQRPGLRQHAGERAGPVRGAVLSQS
jgi:hypothetical protein